MSDESKQPDENADKMSSGEDSVEGTAADSGVGTTEAEGTGPVAVTQPAVSPRRHGTEIWKGIGLTALLHLIPLFFPILYFGIGIVQLLYILPAIIICRKNTGMVQGLLIGAGITFLLNAACFGIVTLSFR